MLFWQVSNYLLPAIFHCNFFKPTLENIHHEKCNSYKLSYPSVICMKVLTLEFRIDDESE